MLNFYLKNGEKINKYYYSAHLLLTEESKQILRNLGEFSDLDMQFQLNTDNFYLWYNKHGYRYELYYKTNSRVYTYPIDWVRFSTEISSQNQFTLHYLGSKEQHIITIPNALETFLGNISYVQGRIAEEKSNKEKEEKLQKEKARERLKYLRKLIDEGKLVLFKVQKRKKAAILSLAKRSSKALGKKLIYELNVEKFYVDSENYLNIVNKDYDYSLDIKKLYFVCNLSGDLSIKPGFYEINSLANFDSGYCATSKEVLVEIDRSIIVNKA